MAVGWGEGGRRMRRITDAPRSLHFLNSAHTYNHKGGGLGGWLGGRRRKSKKRRMHLTRFTLFTPLTRTITRRGAFVSVRLYDGKEG
jgi:hypothetical protein